MIEDYNFGKIVIDGITYAQDIKIINRKVIPNWWRKNGHSICKEDIVDIIAVKPEIFILGTGSFGALKVPPYFVELMKSIGIEFIADKTSKACSIYNNIPKAKRVCFGAHLTC